MPTEEHTSHTQTAEGLAEDIIDLVTKQGYERALIPSWIEFVEELSYSLYEADWQILERLANALEEVGHFREALFIFNALATSRDRVPRFWFATACLNEKLDHVPEARYAYEKAIEKKAIQLRERSNGDPTESGQVEYAEYHLALAKFEHAAGRSVIAFPHAACALMKFRAAQLSSSDIQEVKELLDEIKLRTRGLRE